MRARTPPVKEKKSKIKYTSSSLQFVLPVSPLTKDANTGGGVGKRKSFQEACYAIESKSGDDENELDDLDGMLGEDDFGSSSSVPPPKASPTSDLMECPKRDCSKMFKDLHAIKFHLSHAHNELEEAHRLRMKEKEILRQKQLAEEAAEKRERLKREEQTIDSKEAIRLMKEEVKTEVKEEQPSPSGAALSGPMALVKKEENGHHREQAVNLVRSLNSHPISANGALPQSALTSAAAIASAPAAHQQQRTAIVRPILNSPPYKSDPMRGLSQPAVPGVGGGIPGFGVRPPPAHNLSFNGGSVGAGGLNRSSVPPFGPSSSSSKPAVKAATSPTYSDISDEETETVPSSATATTSMLPGAKPTAVTAPTLSAKLQSHQGLVIPRVQPQVQKPPEGAGKDQGGARPSTQSIGPPPATPSFPGLGPPPPGSAVAAAASALMGSPFSYLSSGVPPPPAHTPSSSVAPPAAHGASMASMMNAMAAAAAAGLTRHPAPGLPGSIRPGPAPPTTSTPASIPGLPPTSAASVSAAVAAAAAQSHMHELLSAANKYLATSKLQELQEKAQGPTQTTASTPFGPSVAAAAGSRAASSPLNVATRPRMTPSVTGPSKVPSAPGLPGSGLPAPPPPPPAHFGQGSSSAAAAAAAATAAAATAAGLPPGAAPPPHSQANPFGFPPPISSSLASLPFSSKFRNLNDSYVYIDRARVLTSTLLFSDLLGNPPRIPPMFPPK